ncbi:hypothetical protein SUGI_0678610 [Cryptomeria japonica]|nr:hypothetical protein SUGI_0678610 [Cryptomeria japonica]
MLVVLGNFSNQLSEPNTFEFESFPLSLIFSAVVRFKRLLASLAATVLSISCSNSGLLAIGLPTESPRPHKQRNNFEYSSSPYKKKDDGIDKDFASTMEA